MVHGLGFRFQGMFGGIWRFRDLGLGFRVVHFSNPHRVSIPKHKA